MISITRRLLKLGESMTNPSTAYVVDASYILSVLLPDEKSRHQSVPQEMFAPNILDYEVVNGLRSATLQKRISQNVATALFTQYQKLPIIKKEISFDQLLQLSIKHQLSAYDAGYLLLAKTLRLQLLSLDKQLIQVSASIQQN
jgi:predicted nucleic acid-binding protein